VGLMIVFSAYIFKGIILGAISFWKEAFGEPEQMPEDSI